MDNFNNKTCIQYFQNSNTEPTPRYRHRTDYEDSLKEDNATSCLLLISQADCDDVRPEEQEEESEERIGVTPWVRNQFRRKLGQHCGRSKTSMLLPPCGQTRGLKTNIKIMRTKTENRDDKENYRSVEKLGKPEKLPAHSKKYSADIKISYSALSKHKEEQTIKNEPPQNPKKLSKPNIVYVLCEEEQPGAKKSFRKHAKSKTGQLSSQSAHVLAPITIGQCSLKRKEGRKYSDTLSTILGQNCIGMPPVKQRVESKRIPEKIEISLDIENREPSPDRSKQIQANIYSKIKKKIVDSIKKQFHIKVSEVEEARGQSKQLKKYMKYSKSKIKNIERELGTGMGTRGGIFISKHPKDNQASSSHYGTNNPLTKILYEKYLKVLNPRCM